MHLFLAVQAGYQNYEVGLFNGIACLAWHKQDKSEASKNLIPVIDDLLKKHSYSIHDLTFIGINKGPAPFTTLRIIIATINGIAFAINIPLVSCSSLEALLHEAHDPAWPAYSVALLNAYNNDVYFAVHHPKKDLWMGCANVRFFLETLKDKIGQEHVRFIGNGVSLFQTLVQEIIGDDALAQTPFIEEASLRTVAHLTYNAFSQKKEISKQIAPLYLKEVAYKTITF
jgi:tRNA threonylcarbamoyladenosine biosynthesis protein TsaB